MNNNYIPLFSFDKIIHPCCYPNAGLADLRWYKGVLKDIGKIDLYRAICAQTKSRMSVIIVMQGARA